MTNRYAPRLRRTARGRHGAVGSPALHLAAIALVWAAGERTAGAQQPTGARPAAGAETAAPPPDDAPEPTGATGGRQADGARAIVAAQQPSAAPQTDAQTTDAPQAATAGADGDAQTGDLGELDAGPAPRDAGTGWLEVEVEPVGAVVVVDDLFERTSPVRVALAPGEHKVVVSAPGYFASTRLVSVTPEEVTTIRVVLEPLPGRVRDGHIAFWGGLGVGGLLATIGHVGATSTANAMRDGNLDAENANRAFSTVAVAGWAVATIGMAVGVALWLRPAEEQASGKLVCQTYKVTGQRLRKKVCVPVKEDD